MVRSCPGIFYHVTGDGTNLIVTDHVIVDYYIENDKHDVEAIWW